ncbi:hypothetical protein [Kitasatospora purpeofusca]|uniref:hypothetical protein n=1 Tax=Kitasatospora purpeofusca TaxID=67352 RepID=UPI0038666445
MIVMQPVLDYWDSDGFDLWPVAEVDPYLPLHGRLTPAEVGTAVMRIVAFNDLDPEPPWRPGGPPVTCPTGPARSPPPSPTP